jgi:tetrahydrodipicolinate N-succinyltransferase
MYSGVGKGVEVGSGVCVGTRVAVGAGVEVGTGVSVGDKSNPRVTKLQERLKRRKVTSKKRLRFIPVNSTLNGGSSFGRLTWARN